MNDQPPLNESWKSLTIHVITPATIALIVVVISLLADIRVDEMFWFQRSGAVMAMVGGYLAFHEARMSWTTIDKGGNGVSVYINNEIWYKWLALVYVLIGTLIWGYGDIPFIV